MVEIKSNTSQTTSEETEQAVPALSLKCLPETKGLQTDASLKEFFVDINIHADDEDEEAQDEDKAIGGQNRNNLFLVAVIDRSGSMGGSKLEMTKKTLKFLIEELTSKDQLSIVAYDTNVDTLLEPTYMTEEGKATGTKIANSLRSLSMTNLAGGLQTGLLKVPAELDATPAVFIMTDGLANVGISSATGIVSMMNEVQSRDAVGRCPVHTFGYGSDHDATFLRTIAEAAEGMYYFIENDDQILDAFADCVAGLLTTRYQTMLLEVEAKEASINKIMTKRKIEEIKKGTHYRVSVGDLQAGEDRDVLISFDVGALAGKPAGTAVLASVSLSYFDVKEEKMGSKTASVTVTRADHLSKELSEKDAHVEAQKLRVQVSDVIREAVELGDKGDVTAGREKLLGFVDTLNKSPIAKESFCQVWMKDVTTHAENMKTQECYQRKGNKMMNNAVHCYSAQRAANAWEGSELEAQACFETKARVFAKKKAAKFK